MLNLMSSRPADFSYALLYAKLCSGGVKSRLGYVKFCKGVLRSDAHACPAEIFRHMDMIYRINKIRKDFAVRYPAIL